MRLFKILRFFILVSPFIDLFVSFCIRYQIIPPVIGTAIRGVFLIFIIYFSLTRLKQKGKYQVAKWLIIIACLCLMTLLCVSIGDGVSSFSPTAVLLLKYWYFPVISLCLVYLFRYGVSSSDATMQAQQISNALYCAGVIYALLIIVPTMMGVSYEAYDVGDMGGSIGLLYAKNEKGALLALMFPFALNRILKKQGRMTSNIVGCGIILAGCFMTGTKAPILAVAISTVFVVIVWRMQKRRYEIIKKLLFFASAAAIMVYAAVNSIAADNLQSRSDYLQCEPASLNETTCLLLSNRDAFLINRANAWTDAPIHEKLFGMSEDSMEGYTTKPLVEMDFADIFFIFGIAGVVFYLLFFARSFGNVLRTWFAAKKDAVRRSELTPYVASLLAALPVAMLAGHVLSAPAVSIVLCLCIAVPRLPSFACEVTHE